MPVIKKISPADKEKIEIRAASYGKTGFRLALKAGILYTLLTITGFIFGGIGGFWVAAHFEYGAWIATIAACLGTIAGGITGFFLAQVIIIGIAQEMLLEAGIKTGKIGFQAAMDMLKEKKKETKR